MLPKIVLFFALSISMVGPSFAASKISARPSVTDLTGSEIIGVIQGGLDKRTTASTLGGYTVKVNGVCDGVTDDTAAIATAITTLGANGGTLLFKPGCIHFVSDRLRPLSNQTWIMTGATLKVSASITIYDNVAAYDNFLIWPANAVDSFRLIGGKVDLTAGTNTEKYACVGTIATTAKNHVIDGLECSGGYRGIYYYGAYNLNIRDAYIHDGAGGFAVEVLYSKRVNMTGTLAEFWGVLRDVAGGELPKDTLGPSWPGSGAFSFTGVQDLVVANNTIYVAGSSALRLTGGSMGFLGGMRNAVIKNNLIIGSGGGGITVALKETDDDWVEDVVVEGNVVRGWSVGVGSDGVGDTAHHGISIGGIINTASGRYTRRVIASNNVLDYLAPWESTTLSAGVLAIAGSYNPVKVASRAETVTASSADGFTVVSNTTNWVTGMGVKWSALSGFTTSGSVGIVYYVVRISGTNIRFATTRALALALTPDITISGSGSCTLTPEQVSGSGIGVGSTSPNATIPHVEGLTLSGNMVKWVPSSGIAVGSTHGSIIANNQITDSGFNANAGEAAGIHVMRSISANVTGNMIRDHQATLSSANGYYLRVQDSARVLVNGNAFNRQNDATNYPMASAINFNSNAGTLSNWGYSAEPYSATIGANTFGFLTTPVALTGTRYAVVNTGLENVLAVSASQTLRPWHSAARKSNATAYTLTLSFAADCGTRPVPIINDGSANSITLAVQTGEKLNGTVDGTLAVTFGSHVIVTGNGVDGFWTQ